MATVVVNPGFNRGSFSAGGLGYAQPPLARDAPWNVQRQINEIQTRIDDLSQNPWQHLLFWEVPYKVKDGLDVLFKTPFLYQVPTVDRRAGVAVPTRLWYPDALHSGVPEKVESAKHLIPFLVTQAREHYDAASHAVISTLSRPVLHFYGAEALARVISTSLFGVCPRSDRTHGLTATPSQPELISWKQHGVFGRFYQAVRADTLYNRQASFLGRYPERPWSPPEVHVDDCLAALHLTPSRFAVGVVPLASCRRHEHPEVLALPQIVLEYLVLYYCSIMARYHHVEWQTLLEGDSPRSLPIRQALAQVPKDFVNDVVQYLPTVASPVLREFPRPRPEWTEDWNLNYWRQPSQAEIGLDNTPGLPPALGFLDEWQPG